MARGLRDLNIGELSSYELVDLLDELYPRMHPQPDVHTHAFIMFEAGKREIVETLLNKKEREQNEQRNSKVSV